METLSYSKTIKARVQHKCDFCLEFILKDENYYRSTHKNDGELYTWKTHVHCAEIASSLKMHDNADDGVTTEFFIDSIKDEYNCIMSKHFNQKYESKDFIVPKFKERLDFVIGFYKIK